jgi:1-acyl-sn-glycerol-3-phosphate acyltransferase
VLPRPDPGVPRASWVYRFAAWLAFLVFRLQRWRYDVRGVEHVPRRGGAVIAANHFSFWDFFLVGRAPYLGGGRPLRILAKESLFRLPVFGWLMRRAEHIPVHRGSGTDAFASAVAALERGELVLVLPEATISPAYELLPFKTGAARMAARAGVPLVPAASWGSHRFHSVGRRPHWSWRLSVTIRYGPPLHPDPDDDPREVTRQLQDAVAGLVDTAVEEHPDGRPAGAWWVPARFGGGAPTPEEADAYLDRVRSSWGRRRRVS